ncbi:Rho GTPase activation protein [Fimicolochytrium jonesii]|uniref:Rho GTPase activation protein n=1 Tax=Fimicolochytrium jonesii TaxID=1396493 RepID=UPI0022FDF6E0|nr:Rho GTPase activation protein [Fimicolochytrium jonesii]KAI8826685.1 Rho GTPase activation protein [Fimicolochytrium jonesii]
MAATRQSSVFPQAKENIFVELADPQTGNLFYANLVTGECTWDRPPKDRIKQKDGNSLEWWELFDENHKLPYYYNTKTGETEWMRPTTGLIIPLHAIQHDSNIGKRVSILVQQQAAASYQPQGMLGRSLGPVGVFGRGTNMREEYGKEEESIQPPRSTRSGSEPDISTLQLATAQSENEYKGATPNKATSPAAGSLGNFHRKSLSTSSPAVNDIRSAAGRARQYGVSTPVLNPEAAEAMSPLHKNLHSTPILNSAKDRQSKVLPVDLKSQLSQFRIEGFASKYFAEHKRGLIFKKTVPLEKLLVYQKDALKTPLMVLNKNLQKDALKCFKLIQKIMKTDPSSAASDTQTLLEKGIMHGGLRDEIYVQMCKQLKGNPDQDSVYRGWILLCVITIAFPPSKNFEEYMKNFVQEHLESRVPNIDKLARHCWKKLTRICRTGPRGKTPTVAEIQRAQEAPFTPALFGEYLEDIMKAELEKHPNAEVPQILPFLADAIIDLNGCKTEGIFRVPGDADAVTELRMRIEKGTYDLQGLRDPNVPSSLLKLWLRDLADPLIPSEFYDACVKVGQDESRVPLSQSGPAALAIIAQMPEANQKVIHYMMRFLRVVADPKNQPHTKMTISNLAMVFAPNFLRCPSDNPTIIFESTKFEQAFLRILISYVQ